MAASTLATDGVTEMKASYSSYGSTVDFCAPSNDRGVHDPPTAYGAHTATILAAPEGRAEDVRRAIRHAEVVRVATKFPDTARRYFERMGRQAEIIELHGSIELAPLVGLAECIIDLTATGTTLRENDLVVLDEISTSTARLISNRGSYRLRHSEVVALADAMQQSGELFG